LIKAANLSQYPGIIEREVNAMRLFLKIVTATCILSSVLILGFVFGWFGPKKATSETQVQPAESTSSAPEPTMPDSMPPSTAQQPGPAAQGRTNISRAIPPTPGTATTTNAEWEDKLEAILGAEGEDAEKIKQLYAMFPQLPEDGQVEVAQHLSNLVSDQDYAPLGKMLADSKEPEAVLDVLIADLLNRPNGTKLPLLLEVARNAQHPKAVEAKDLLELYLEEDYGQNWDKWQAKTEQWLKDNPD
jgi:hypothetical protein